MRLYLLGIFCAIGSVAFSQSDTIKPWKVGGMGQLNFTQAAYSNWAQGGENTLALTANMRLFANYSNDNIRWTNELNGAYGKIKTGDNLRKSDDEIILNSKYTRKFTEKLGLGINGNFRSQFDRGYKYPNDSVVISKFLAPAYVSVSVGLDYIPAEYLTIFISPISLKWTYVGDTATVPPENYGVDADRKSRYEFGGYFKADFSKEVLNNVTASSTLELFSNYLEEPQNIDINWLNKLNLKVNDYITASVTVHLIYDHDILIPKTNDEGETYLGRGTQFREVLSLGLSYKF